MSYHITHAEKLIETVSSDYMEKIFYFCLKKTGNHYEAEDLTSDIMFHIINELRKGTIPLYLSAWVWQIARNRYCAWATNKHKQSNMFSFDDSDDVCTLDAEQIENKYIKEEEIKLLRRELAFISSEYRGIIVAYYIDDKKVRDIATSLDLPEGTVKTKLFQSRKILKEGMKMAREFGVRSYKPENIGLVKSGYEGVDGSPWTQVKKSMAKNILLEAYYNPSTIEELSIELGVAIPYMEEEVMELEAVELLNKSGSKYETNFMILSKDVQRNITIKQSELSEYFFKTICEMLQIIEDDATVNNTKLYGGYQDFEDIKWTLMLRISDLAGEDAFNKKYKSVRKDGYHNRPRNGKWDMIGFEDYKNDETIPFVGLHGGYCDFNFGNYKIDYKGLLERAGEVEEYEVRNLKKLLRGDLDKCDTSILDSLVKRGFLRKENDNYIPTFIVSNGNILEQSCTTKIYKDKLLPLYNKLIDIMLKLHEYIEECLLKEIPPRLKNMIWFAAETLSMRGHMVVKGVESGVLKIPEHIEKSTMGVYCIL